MTQSARFLKYRFLSRFPGTIGRRYSAKMIRLTTFHNTQQRFRKALRECEGLPCIDIGANVGNYTIMMAKFASHVYSFEPDPFAFRELDTIACSLKNVTLIDSAVGGEDHNVVLYRSKKFNSDPFVLSQASSVIAANHLDKGSSFQVSQVSIVNFLNELDLDVGVMKIDAEGAEVTILESLLENPSVLGRVRYIFAEFHERLFPELGQRYKAIRARVAMRKTYNPTIDLNWH